MHSMAAPLITRPLIISQEHRLVLPQTHICLCGIMEVFLSTYCIKGKYKDVAHTFVSRLLCPPKEASLDNIDTTQEIMAITQEETCTDEKRV